MLEINKKEFFKEYNLGDIYGLENLQKQLDKMGKDLFNDMQKNMESNDILKNEKAEEFCEKQKQIIRANSVLNFTIQVNYLYVETQTTNYAEKYYSELESLYSKLINDLFNMLNITNEDFNVYAN